MVQTISINIKLVGWFSNRALAVLFNTTHAPKVTYVSLGAMQLWEYRMKHYAEDEETAKKMVVQQADVIED